MTKDEYHELGHTAYLMGAMIEDHIVNVYADMDLTDKCEQAAKILADVYQMAMARSLG